MAKYRSVLCAMWGDRDFEEYSSDGKLLFLYLCTNAKTTESGIYPLTIKTIRNDTDLKANTIKKLLTSGLKNVSYDSDNAFVFVHRFMNYNSGGNPAQIEAGIRSDNHNYQTPLWSKFIEIYPYLKSGFETKKLNSYYSITNTNSNTITIEPLGNSCSTVGQPLKKYDKVKHLDCVLLKDDEYQNLVKTRGVIETKRAIEILNNYKMSSGKKYKSDYHALLNWVFKRVEEEKGGTDRQSNRRGKAGLDADVEKTAEEITRRTRKYLSQHPPDGAPNI